MLKSELILAPTGDGIRAFAGFPKKETVKADQVDPWALSLQRAADQLREDLPTFSWTALVGAVGLQIRGAQLVTESSRIGPFAIDAASDLLSEGIAQTSPPNLGSRSVAWSYPLIVRGSSVGYNWLKAQRQASAGLQRLCALLTVALGTNWRVREAPRLASMGEVRIPSSDDWMGMVDTDPNIMTERIAIPDWCSEGLRRAENDPILMKALHSHHQGLALEEIAPSHSLLAYVGAIEGLGAKLEDLRRCECCADCTINIGAGRRFRQALKLVMTSKEARTLASAYDRRSKIAHEGALLGGEDHGGAMSQGELFAPRPDSQDFVYQTLWAMKGASRQVLHHFLHI